MSTTSRDAIFPQATRAAWEGLAKTSLKGRAIDDLARPHEDEIFVEALYSSASHVEALPDHISANAARQWVIAQYLEPAGDAAVLNAMVLEELTGGTERLIFPNTQNISTVHNAMDGVVADAIVLSFDNPSDPQAAMDALVQIWSDQGTSPELARGAIGAVITPATCSDLLAIISSAEGLLARYPLLRVLKISGTAAHRNGATPAQELAVILAQFTMMMRMAEQAGPNLNDVMARLEIDIAFDADIYGGIAKARALRNLMGRMLDVMDISCDNLCAQLHGITSDRMLALLDPETNMLRAGTAMLSMALSGLGVITNRPHDWLTGSWSLSRRIARNTHHILADESQLNHIADPAQGSYYIDRLTHELSEKAWRLFQEIEREGGLNVATEKDVVAAWYNTAVAQRNSRVNRGVDSLLGVSIHPISGGDKTHDVLIEPCADIMMPRGGNHRPAASWEELVYAFAPLKARCLLIDGGGGHSAGAVKRWMDAFGLEAAVMSADDGAACIRLITAASPDIVVLGDELTLEQDHLAALTSLPILLKTADFEGDIIALMTNILASLKEGGGS